MRFPAYAFDPATGVATFDYLLDGAGALRFTETITFPRAGDRARTPSTGSSTCCTWSPG
jgi:hypothetical protein